MSQQELLKTDKLNQARVTRREYLRFVTTAATTAMLPSLNRAIAAVTRSTEPAASGAMAVKTDSSAGDARMQGLFLIPSTPYTSSGAVDYDDLAREAKFMEWCGVNGIVWPQASETVAFLSKEEKLKGMEVLTKANIGQKTVLCLGVNGHDTADMLDYARHAEALAPGAVISRPPDSGTSQQDILEYYRALGKIMRRPVIIQGTGGYNYKGPTPSVELITQLQEEFPQFGYVKEETAPLYPTTADRMRIELKSQPPVKCIFSAWGALGWLYEMRIGSRGLITERVAYADLMVRIRNAFLSGHSEEARDLYSKFLLLADLNLNLADSQGFRDPHLYILKKRGVIKTTISRFPDGSFKELSLPPDMIDEIEYRFAAVKPYLRSVEFRD